MKLYSINKKNKNLFTAREIIEFYVTNQQDVQSDRKYKYFLGEVIAEKILNGKNNNNKSKI
jgi:hypothetical protein